MTDKPKPKPKIGRPKKRGRPRKHPKKPEPLIDLRGKHGKKRRGTEPAVVASVRIDPEAKRALTHNFGSLGNALYYLYEGIKDLTKAHSPEPDITPEAEPVDTLNKREIHTIMLALNQYYNNCGGRAGTGNGGGQTRVKISRILFKLNDAVRDN